MDEGVSGKSKGMTDEEKAAQSAGVPTGEELGARIRRLRNERNWTLQELAERAGVSLSTLSKVENAQVAPTFDTLVKAAQGLGIRFEVLISTAETQSSPPSAEPVTEPSAQKRPTGGRLMVTRAAEAVNFSTPMYEYRVHANALRRKFMTPLVMEIKARSLEDVTSWSQHEGEEFILVLAGSVAMHTEYYDPVQLEAGDSCYIDSGMAHMFLTTIDRPARIASICYSNQIDRPEVMVALPEIAN